MFKKRIAKINIKIHLIRYNCEQKMPNTKNYSHNTFTKFPIYNHTILINLNPIMK